MELYKPLSVIIVDDDQGDRELLNFLFTKNSSFKIVGCFDSGLEVLEEIITKRNVPDVLIIDMYMPFLTGTEVLQKLLVSKVAPNMTTFIISTNINVTEEDKHIGNLAVKFIKKPVTLAEINDLPGSLLECLNYRNNTKV